MFGNMFDITFINGLTTGRIERRKSIPCDSSKFFIVFAVITNLKCNGSIYENKTD